MFSLSLFEGHIANKCFPDSSVGKESAFNAGDPSSISGLGRSPREGNSYPLQYSGLENSMDCIVHGGHKESDTTEQLHTINLILLTFSFLCFISLSYS